MVTINKWKKILTRIVNDNKKLAKDGFRALTPNIVGHHGIGKSLSCNQVGRRQGMYTHILNLAQLEREDLIGYPMVQYKAFQKYTEQDDDGNTVQKTRTKWINKDLMEEAKAKGFQISLQTRTTYAKPDWLEGREEPMILVLDDERRCSGDLIQAVMSLKLDQSYANWSLPKGSTVVCTNNPVDDANYSVSEQDSAQDDRSIDFELQFDLDQLCSYLEGRIDDRLINFIISEGQDIILRTNQTTEKEEIMCSPRALESYGHAIKSAPNMSDLEDLEYCLDIGRGALPEGIAERFVEFVSSKLDKLPKPDFIFKSADPVKEILAIIGTPGSQQYRTDVACIVSKRIAHYLAKYTGSLSQKEKDKFVDFISSKVLLEDNNYYILRTLSNADNRARWKPLLADPRIVRQYTSAHTAPAPATPIASPVAPAASTTTV